MVSKHWGGWSARRHLRSRRRARVRLSASTPPRHNSRRSTRHSTTRGAPLGTPSLSTLFVTDLVCPHPRVFPRPLLRLGPPRTLPLARAAHKERGTALGLSLVFCRVSASLCLVADCVVESISIRRLRCRPHCPPAARWTGRRSRLGPLLRHFSPLRSRLPRKAPLLSPPPRSVSVPGP